ncbi:MAG: hypothetical protein A3F12_00735 [Gammaproteobacteria bacterium RIFCSPHIGHO2_12_FULL_38_14]|nr:MAG: hypothetical protein A3F12_00735 [Gammaproteobacteria bacterium RIFCSPHIGHO2_12_FULL_38_14]
MNVLLNAITIKEGGGAVVFYKTLNEMLLLDSSIKWVVVIDEKMRKNIQVNERVTLLNYPWIKKSPLHYLYWNEFYLPKLIKKHTIDCVYSVINTLPFRRLACCTLLSIIHAGYFSEEFISLNKKYNSSFRARLGWKIRKEWVCASLYKANKIVSPTKALVDAILHQLKINPEKMSVVLPGPGLAQESVTSKGLGKKKQWRIGYITKYGVQKNFEVLFKAASELKLKRTDFKIILTLNTEHKLFQFIQAMINQYDIADVIENHGEVTDNEIQQLYLTLDLFVFPSLCESIGFTLLEAMYSRIPVIASDIKSNRELLGENGLFFSPYDHKKLVDCIISITSDDEKYLKASKYCYDRGHQFSWRKSAHETLRIIKDVSCVTS